MKKNMKKSKSPQPNNIIDFRQARARLLGKRSDRVAESAAVLEDRSEEVLRLYDESMLARTAKDEALAAVVEDELAMADAGLV